VKRYTSHLVRLETMNCERVLQYFMEAWHPIREQWVEGFKQTNFCLGESTNNRLESINAKIKSVCSKYASLKLFFIEFFQVLASLRGERTHKAVMMLVKRPTIPIEPDIFQFFELLTPYAFKIVSHQYELSLALSFASEDDEFAEYDSSSGLIRTSAISCSCCQFKMTGLPCKHILHYRKHLSFSLFADDTCNQRWYRINYREHCSVRYNPFIGPSSVTVAEQITEELITPSDAMSQHKKFKKAKQVTDILAALCSEPGMNVFTRRLQLLQYISEEWKQGNNLDSLIPSSEGAPVPYENASVANVSEDQPTEMPNHGKSDGGSICSTRGNS
jgi:hypothetical protein